MLTLILMRSRITNKKVNYFKHNLFYYILGVNTMINIAVNFFEHQIKIRHNEKKNG